MHNRACKRDALTSSEIDIETCPKSERRDLLPELGDASCSLTSLTHAHGIPAR